MRWLENTKVKAEKERKREWEFKEIRLKLN
jgi:hypothetical protein